MSKETNGTVWGETAILGPKGETLSWNRPPVDVRDEKIAQLEAQLNRAIEHINSLSQQAQKAPTVEKEKTVRERTPDSKSYWVIRKGKGAWEVKSDLRGLASGALRATAALRTGMEFKQGVTRFDCYEAISDAVKSNKKPAWYVEQYGRIKDGGGINGQLPQVENRKTVVKRTIKAQARPKVAGQDMADMFRAFQAFMAYQNKA